MDEAAAVAAFQALGIAGAKPELCYFLHYDGQAATAIPAWRVLNSFIAAENGERLQ